MKRLLLISVLVFLLLGIGKVVDYYFENRLYVHYVLKSYLSTRESIVKDGYTDKTSYSYGEEQRVFINAKSSASTFLRLYDIDGLVVDSVKVEVKPQQPADNPAENGFGYQVTFKYSVPTLASGIYLWEKKIPFTIKGDSNMDIVVLYPSNTVNAYNISGGKSLYKIFSEQTHQVSFQRPVFPAIHFFALDALKWLKNSDYKVRYINDQDFDNISTLAGAKILLIIGHSEYWTRAARENMDAYIARGGHTVVLSGNTMWWHVRYNESRTALICYKQKNDPVADKLKKTTSWSSPELQYPILPSIGADFSYAGYGRKYLYSFGGYRIVKPNSPLFKGVKLKKTDILQVSSKEYDGAPLLGEEPDLELDKKKLGYYKAELLGYDRARDAKPGNATFIIFQRTAKSGIVINVATTDWCGAYGMGGPDGDAIKKITHNMLQGLLQNKNLFTSEE